MTVWVKNVAQKLRTTGSFKTDVRNTNQTLETSLKHQYVTSVCLKISVTVFIVTNLLDDCYCTKFEHRSQNTTCKLANSTKTTKFTDQEITWKSQVKNKMKTVKIVDKLYCLTFDLWMAYSKTLIISAFLIYETLRFERSYFYYFNIINFTRYLFF